MARVFTATIAVIFSPCVLLLAQSGAIARSGASVSSSHIFHKAIPGHRITGHPRTFRKNGYGAYVGYPWYGGYISTMPYQYNDGGEAPQQIFVVVPEPPRALDCHRSRETVTVPSEEGGTKNVNITRC